MTIAVTSIKISSLIFLNLNTFDEIISKIYKRMNSNSEKGNQYPYLKVWKRVSFNSKSFIQIYKPIKNRVGTIKAANLLRMVAATPPPAPCFYRFIAEKSADQKE